MKSLLLFLSLISLTAFASDDYRHQVSFGRYGFGWTGSYETMDTTHESPFGNVSRLVSELGINYAYRFGRFQVGGFYQNSNDEYKIKRRGGGYSPTEIEVESYGVFALYNFSDDFASAWFAGLSFGMHKYSEENSHDFEASEKKAPFELDDSGNSYELLVGKRFSLEHWEIKHITYSPMISVYTKTHGKDFDDQDVDKGIGFSLQPIRFDVLF